MKSLAGFGLVWTTASVFPPIHPAFAEPSSSTVQADLAAWISRNGGYVHDQQDYRPVLPHADDSDYGMFATEDIPEHRILLEIPIQDPHSLLLDISQQRLAYPSSDEPTSVPCKLIHYLLQQLHLVNNATESQQDSHSSSKVDFAPYINFIFDSQTIGHTPSIPSLWSQGGQYLLRYILGTDLDYLHHYYRLPPTEPTDWYDPDFVSACHPIPYDDITEQELDQAIVWAVSHNTPDGLVPGLEWYRHHNGQACNVELRFVNAEGYNIDHIDMDQEDDDDDYDFEPVYAQLVTTRDIAKGEEIRRSFNNCPRCGRRLHSYGTPEILRDMGFVEDYPRKYIIHDFEYAFEVSKAVETDSLTFRWASTSFADDDDTVVEPEDQPTKNNFQGVLEAFYRLNRLQVYDFARGKDDWERRHDAYLLNDEWDTAMEYVNATVEAFRLAVEAMYGSTLDCLPIPASSGGNDIGSVCLYSLAFHPSQKITGFNKNGKTCNVDKLLTFDNYDIVEDFRTEYQAICYQVEDEDEMEGENPEGNVCMDLEDTVQICTSYRPHYHEYSVHYAARYLSSVKRVMFIGGGDSMILHETLKYPDLELVVGLELDQLVVRSSFKWFHTQPHFDDERVQWWFGDATKSLLLLPKDWANSFDLIVVDLSETVASLTVTDHLDVLEALSLFLKPDGVMLKNELYFEKMSRTFDHVIEFQYYDCPTICDQTMVIGSNGIDLFHENLHDHELLGDLLILPEFEDLPDEFYLVHDYGFNNATAEGKCLAYERAAEKAVSQTSEHASRSKGMVLVLDLEHVGSSPVEDIKKTLTEAGMSIGAVVEKDDGATTVILEEGYVTILYWENYHYAAVDVFLWQKFNEMAALEKGIVRQVRTSNPGLTASTYRVIASGVYGADKDEEIGPDLTKHTRNCESPVLPGADDSLPASSIREEFVKNAFEEINTHEDEKTILVLCDANSTCETVAALAQADSVASIIPFRCTDLPSSGKLEELEPKLFACEYELVNMIETKLGVGTERQTYLHGVVLDVTASESMGKVFRSFLSNQVVITQFLSDAYTLVVPHQENKAESWRSGILERHLKFLKMDPVFRAQMVAKDTARSLGLELMVVGNPGAINQIYRTEIEVRSSLPSVDIAVQHIQGGLAHYKTGEEYNPQIFPPSAYDSADAVEQFAEQVALGRQTILQLSLTSADTIHRSLEVVFRAAVDKVYSSGIVKHVSAMGDALLVVVQHASGHAMLLWDGMKHATVNVFSTNESKDVADAFLQELANAKWVRELRDDMPRGINKVINFESDKTSNRVEDPNTIKELAAKADKDRRAAEEAAKDESNADADPIAVDDEDDEEQDSMKAEL